MNVVPGLTCPLCWLPLSGSYARRTERGWAHAKPCTSPNVLSQGRWVKQGMTLVWKTAA